MVMEEPVLLGRSRAPKTNSVRDRIITLSWASVFHSMCISDTPAGWIMLGQKM